MKVINERMSNQSADEHGQFRRWAIVLAWGQCSGITLS